MGSRLALAAAKSLRREVLRCRGRARSLGSASARFVLGGEPIGAVRVVLQTKWDSERGGCAISRTTGRIGAG